MIIALIFWRIKPTDEAVSQFLTWWREDAIIGDKVHLAGEYLSEPLPASRLPFRVDDLAPRDDEPSYRPFVNVGLWKDWESFFDQVGHNFGDDQPLMSFEARRRTRTLLEPTETRVGLWSLPAEGTCD